MCVFCKGKVKQDVTDFIESNAHHVIIVKDVPCEKCKQCGETYFDNGIVQALERTLARIQRKTGDVTLTVIDYAKSAA